MRWLLWGDKKMKETDRRRRGRNLVYTSISLLLSFLRRTPHLLLPVSTQQSPFGTSFTGAPAATLDLPELAAFAGLGHTPTGDEVRSRETIGHGVGDLLVLLTVVVVWNREGHGGVHWGRRRVGTLMLVGAADLEM